MNEKNYKIKYALQPICFKQDQKSINQRFNYIASYISTNIYNREPIGYIVSKCYVVDELYYPIEKDYGVPMYRVVFPYNPKYGLIKKEPYFDEQTNTYLNSLVTMDVYDTFEEAIDAKYYKNLDLIYNHTIKSPEQNYMKAYKNAKEEVLNIEGIELLISEYTKDLKVSHSGIRKM